MNIQIKFFKKKDERVYEIITYEFANSHLLLYRTDGEVFGFHADTIEAFIVFNEKEKKRKSR